MKQQHVKQPSRRTFLKAAAVASVGPMILPARIFGADAPGRQITVGFIGCGRQAYVLNIPPMLRMAGVRVVAVCDVDAWRMEEARKLVDGFYGVSKGCRCFRDFRELLACPDIDAVMISTGPVRSVPAPHCAMSFRWAPQFEIMPSE